MEEIEKQEKKKGFSLDWLIGGVLSKLGDNVDRVTGRGWNPSSSLATTQLVEKLKFLMDEEAHQEDSGGTFVPHVITLKMQWNKFSADSEGDLEKLRNELHAAAIDHINDRLYHTYAPIEIDIKTDYFTEGVRLIGSFGQFGGEDEEAAVNVTLPQIKVEQMPEGSRASISLEEPQVEDEIAPPVDVAVSFLVNGKKFEQKLDFASVRRCSVGRGAENQFVINHVSVSKVHASLVMNSGGKLMVADTGSTNGTFVSGNRIAYGKAFEVEGNSIVRFGTIDVEFGPIDAARPDVEQPEVFDPVPVLEEELPPTAADVTPVAELSEPAPTFAAEAAQTEKPEVVGEVWNKFESENEKSLDETEAVDQNTQDWEI